MYNPLPRKRNYFVRLPVRDGKYEVFSHNGGEIIYQLLPITEETKDIPERPMSEAEKDLVFKADLPALGIATFFIQRKDNQFMDNNDEDWLEEKIIELAEESLGPEPYKDAVEIIENQYYTVTVDRNTGLISRLWNKEEDIAVSLKQNFFYYISHPGYNYNGKDQASGAYIFRPASNTQRNVSKDHSVNVTAYKGGLVQEIRQVFCSWVSQVVRLYDNQRHIELEWTIGPLPSGDGREGKEVITKYMTDLETEGALYTDLNGRETLKRRRNERDTWQFEQSEPVAGNYYPVTSRAAIKDERRGVQLSVLVDRSQGAASIQNGNLEIMVHRRTFYDDSLGVQEPLTEYGASGKGIVVRGKHYVMVNKMSRAASVYRPLYHKIYHQPFTSFSTELSQYSDWSDIQWKTWSGVKQELPRNVHLLSLDVWRKPVVETSYMPLLLRLEHVFEKFEDENMSGPVTVDLQDVFKPFQVMEVIELSLGANMKIEDMNRFVWKVKHDVPNVQEHRVNHQDNEFEIELAPMQIKTFQINVHSHL